ncbi:MAG TPA: hypothetical protein VN947_12035 [Polyangia bacterium]|nr:hypothetical protein [Polyangia bacterium]
MAASRHPLVVGTRWLLPIAIALALVGAFAAHTSTARIIAAGFAALGGLAWWWQERHRPTLVIDEAGWAIEQQGKEKLRVVWSEVLRVRVDRRENALYVDTGDKARNLLIPPRSGYGFRFADAATACARLLAAVPADRVEEVERLDVA